MITKNSDFNGQFQIANSEDGSPNSDLIGNNTELQLFINEFEPRCLITVLGYALYAELKPELLKKPFVTDAQDTADAKWVELVNGKDNYFGLKPIIVPYVYFHFLKSDDSSHTGVGVVKEAPKGARNYSPREKAVLAWRTFYEAAQGYYPEFTIASKQSAVGNITGIIYDYDQSDKIMSLYTFLAKNIDTYPNANPSVLENITQYGI